MNEIAIKEEKGVEMVRNVQCVSIAKKRSLFKECHNLA